MPSDAKRPVSESRSDSQAIRRYRVHQNRTGAIEMQIEIDPARNLDTDPENLRHAISHLVEGYPVDLEITTNLQRSKSAKHRAVTSELTAAYLAGEIQPEACVR